MVISRTPFRISFFGGGTDYPVWFKENGGAVLSSTIDKYCYISVRYLPPFFEHKHRIVYSFIENVKSVGEIKHPAVKAILRYMRIKNGLEIHHDGDLPARSGIASSSAFTVGMLNAFYALKGNMISKSELAKRSIHVERNILKENVGSQDQVAVAYGGLNRIVFHSDNNFRVEPVTIAKTRVKELENHLMLIFTGISRYASEIALSQIRYTQNRKKELADIREMVNQALEILNSNTNITEFGKLLHDAWQLKKSLSQKVSNPMIDDVYAEALRSGAKGGKILGAGGGGFMLLFVPPGKRERLKQRLHKFIEVKFSFENNGSQIIYYNPKEIEINA